MRPFPQRKAERAVDHVDSGIGGPTIYVIDRKYPRVTQVDRYQAKAHGAVLTSALGSYEAAYIRDRLRSSTPSSRSRPQIPV
jgi:hypothetical protein